MVNCVVCGGRSINREEEEIKCKNCSGRAKLMQSTYIKKYHASDKGKQKRSEANGRYRETHPKIKDEDIPTGGLRTPENELELEPIFENNY